MENFDDIKKSVIDLVNENEKLEDQVKETRKKLGSIIEENYNKIVDPVLDELEGLDHILGIKASMFDTIKHEDLPIYYVPKHWSNWGLHYTSNGNSVSPYYVDEQTIENFSTVEKALAFVEVVKKIFVERFKTYAPILEERNKEIKNKLDDLVESLNNSSTIKKQDDGTVEIKLGDKTFVGTIKEV